MKARLIKKRTISECKYYVCDSGCCLKKIKNNIVWNFSGQNWSKSDYYTDNVDLLLVEGYVIISETNAKKQFNFK